MKVSKLVVSPEIGEFVQFINDHQKLGWELNKNNPARHIGWLFEVEMFRDEEIVDPDKPSRSEILAKARASKAAKKAEQEAE
jgi:hypothetical protein